MTSLFAEQSSRSQLNPCAKGLAGFKIPKKTTSAAQPGGVKSNAGALFKKPERPEDPNFKHICEQLAKINAGIEKLLLDPNKQVS